MKIKKLLGKQDRPLGKQGEGSVEARDDIALPD